MGHSITLADLWSACKSRKDLMGVGLLFAAAGALFLVLMFGPRVVGVIRSRSWVATPCMIISSSVEHSQNSTGRSGSTYRVAIRYRYQVDGREYVGDRYNWWMHNSSGYSATRAVAALSAEADATCFVNPANPAESVLDRDVGGEAAFILLPLAFIAIGIGFIYGGIRSYFRMMDEAEGLAWEWWRGRSSAGRGQG